jgi:hypothetical protein
MAGNVYTKYAKASVPIPASASLVAEFVDGDGIIKYLFSDATWKSYQKNSSGTVQTPSAATRTYITGTKIALAIAGQLQVGAAFRWRFDIVKTGAGTATSTIDIAVGTGGTTADTARVSFTKPAGTAVADSGYVQIDAVVRAIGASTVISGTIEVGHNLSTTGHMAQQQFVTTVDSGSFDSTTALFLGVCFTSGASDVITIKNVITEAWDI